METIGNRITQVRKDSHLSMEEFGKRIGIKKSSCSLLESGKNQPSKQTVMLICSEFNVNQDWLLTGEGEPYIGVPKPLIDELTEKYQLGETERQIVNGYLALTEPEREIFLAFIKAMVERHKENNNE